MVWVVPQMKSEPAPSLENVRATSLKPIEALSGVSEPSERTAKLRVDPVWSTWPYTSRNPTSALLEAPQLGSLTLSFLGPSILRLVPPIASSNASVCSQLSTR